MKQLLSVLLAASLTMTVSYATAQTSDQAPKKTVKKAEKKSTKKAAKKADEQDPDITASAASEYECIQGHKITVYRNPADAENAAMRWDKKLYAMKRIETQSGAERLESKKPGLVFIGIPAKAMLFDAKKGRLADECKLPSQ
jgi:hypothetical protein